MLGWLLKQFHFDGQRTRCRVFNRDTDHRVCVSVLDDVVTDLGPIKNGARRDVGCRVFHQIEYASNRDAAARVGTDAKLGDADQLSKDNDIAGGNLNVGNDRDRHALVDVNRPDGCDDGVAHRWSSLAQANANEVVGRRGVSNDLAE